MILLSLRSVNIPFNRFFVSYLVSQINAGAGTSWQLLEVLAAYLMWTIPGLQVINLGLVTGGQVDVLVRNSAPSGQPLRWIGDYLLVECKDWNERVTEKEFGHFLSKLVLNKAKQGIIISRSGLSGSPHHGFASRDQKVAFSQSDVVVLDIRLNEIQGLAGVNDLVEMLQLKYEELRFKK